MPLNWKMLTLEMEKNRLLNLQEAYREIENFGLRKPFAFGNRIGPCVKNLL